MSQAKQPTVTKQPNKAEARQAVQKQQAPELLSVWGQNPAVMRRMLNDPRSMNAAKIAHLQRTIGNQALGQWKTNLPSVPINRNEVSDKSLNPVLGEAIPALANSANTVQSLTSEGAQSSTLLENRRPATKYHAVSQVQRDEDNSDKKSWYEKAGDWALGAIGGEFVDEQTFGQIGVDFVISVIPILDQISDVRDLVANIYRIGFKGEHSKIMRWISLVFTLIGCIPEVGSVIKSLSKMAIRGIGNVLEHIGDILRLASKILPGQITNPWHLQDYIRKNWPRFASFATQQWNWLLSQGGRLVNRLPDFAGIRKLALAKLNNLAKMSSGWFPSALEHLRAKIDDILEQVRAFFRRSDGPRNKAPTLPKEERLTGRTEHTPGKAQQNTESLNDTAKTAKQASDEAVVTLPNGKTIRPDHYRGGFHGTSKISPAKVKELGGLPARGENLSLLDHVEGRKGDSAFRGVTPMPGRLAEGQGAAEWAGKDGWVYEIENVPTWDANKHLEGQVPTVGGYGNNPWAGEIEQIIPAEIPISKIKRWGRVIDERGRIEWHEW